RPVPEETEAYIRNAFATAEPPRPSTWPLFGIPTRTENFRGRLPDGTVVQVTRQYYCLRCASNRDPAGDRGRLTRTCCWRRSFGRRASAWHTAAWGRAWAGGTRHARPICPRRRGSRHGWARVGHR